MNSKLSLVTPLISLLALAHARSAAAQPVMPAPPTPDEKFAAALDHLDNGDNAAALAAFLSIPLHERTRAVHCNVGLVESKMGHPAESVEALEQCVESTVFLGSRAKEEQRNWRALLTKQQKLVGWLSVAANIDGATVQVDGRPRARIPFTKPLPVAGGAHEIRVVAPGHVPVVTKITMKALDQQTIRFELVRTATLSISTKLPRAEVVVDGAVAGATPLSTPLELEPGEHDIEVRRGGYVTFRVKKKLVPGAEQSIEANLTEDAAWIDAHGGSLALTLVEQVPLLWVDGQQRNFGQRSLRLAPGMHHVLARKDGFEPIERDIEIESGGTTTIPLRLTPTQATLDQYRAGFERRRRWGIGLLAGGAVLGSVGAGVLGHFTQQAERRDPTRNEALDLCDPENKGANRTPCPAYRLGQALGGVGIGLGVAMLVTGAWLFLGNDRSRDAPASTARGVARLPVVPLLGVTPGKPEASIGLLGSF